MWKRAVCRDRVLTVVFALAVSVAVCAADHPHPDDLSSPSDKLEQRPMPQSPPPPPPPPQQPGHDSGIPAEEGSAHQRGERTKKEHQEDRAKKVQDEAAAVGAARKAGHVTTAEAAFAMAKTALERGDIEAATSLRATAAREFELGGSDKAAELSALGKIIGDASEKKQAADLAAKKTKAEEHVRATSTKKNRQDEDASSRPVQHSEAEHNEQFVIEEEVANHGLIEYTAPEDQALDHLIRMASKGLRIITSGAVVGFQRARLVVTRTARRIARRGVGETLSMWFGANDTARRISVNKALLSVQERTAVVLARTPDYIDRSREILDRFAQRSLERGLELLEVSAKVAQVVGAASLDVAERTKERVEKALASPEGQAAKASAIASINHLLLVAREAAKVTGNRILWSMAQNGDWLSPPAAIDFKSGLLLVYRDTNNIHAFIPVLTKPHQFLGTFSDERAEEEEEEEEEEEHGEDRGGRQGAPSSTRRTHERTRSEEERARQPLQAGQPLQQGAAADQAQGLVGGEEARGALPDEQAHALPHEHAHVEAGDAPGGAQRGGREGSGESSRERASGESEGEGARRRWHGAEKSRRSYGAEKCAAACWSMTSRAMEACMGFRFAGGWLIDEASRARCPVCRSFVYYSAQHSNSNLATKCFGITSDTWAPAYEPHVTSGLFEFTWLARPAAPPQPAPPPAPAPAPASSPASSAASSSSSSPLFDPALPHGVTKTCEAWAGDTCRGTPSTQVTPGTPSTQATPSTQTTPSTRTPQQPEPHDHTDIPLHIPLAAVGRESGVSVERESGLGGGGHKSLERGEDGGETSGAQAETSGAQAEPHQQPEQAVPQIKSSQTQLESESEGTRDGQAERENCPAAG